jgi:hypothetical protein
MKYEYEKKRFYSWMRQAYCKCGNLSLLSGQVDTCHDVGKLPDNYHNLVFQLEGGPYAPFMGSNAIVELVCKELKQLIEDNIPPDTPVEFIPAKIVSEGYGDKTYYIINIIEIYADVIDQAHSKRIPETGDITVPCYFYEKCKDLVLFQASRFSPPIVSNNLKKIIIKEKLNGGIYFHECHMC